MCVWGGGGGGGGGRGELVDCFVFSTAVSCRHRTSLFKKSVAFFVPLFLFLGIVFIIMNCPAFIIIYNNSIIISVIKQRRRLSSFVFVFVSLLLLFFFFFFFSIVV